MRISRSVADQQRHRERPDTDQPPHRPLIEPGEVGGGVRHQDIGDRNGGAAHSS
jgi:hypothetical protein